MSNQSKRADDNLFFGFNQGENTAMIREPQQPVGTGDNTVVMGGGQPAPPSPPQGQYGQTYGQQQSYYQPQQPAYEPQPAYGYEPQERKSGSKTLLWVAICVSAAAITAVVVFGIFWLVNRSQPEESAMDMVNATPATEQAAPESTLAPAQQTASPYPGNQEVDVPEETMAQVSTPYTSGYDAATSLATNALSSAPFGTYYGMTAGSFRDLRGTGKVTKNGSSSYLRVNGSDGFTYSYVFKNGSVYNDGSRLTSISVERTMSDPWNAAAQFDAYLLANGASMVASSANGRCIYRLPSGNYASSGYSGKKFIVYFYYSLFENSLIDNAAPRK